MIYGPQHECFSGCGPQASSISPSWEQGRNAHSQAPPIEAEPLGEASKLCFHIQTGWFWGRLHGLTVAGSLTSSPRTPPAHLTPVPLARLLLKQDGEVLWALAAVVLQPTSSSPRCVDGSLRQSSALGHLLRGLLQLPFPKSPLLFSFPTLLTCLHDLCYHLSYILYVFTVSFPYKNISSMRLAILSVSIQAIPGT